MTKCLLAWFQILLEISQTPALLLLLPALKAPALQLATLPLEASELDHNCVQVLDRVVEALWQHFLVDPPGEYELLHSMLHLFGITAQHEKATLTRQALLKASEVVRQQVPLQFKAFLKSMVQCQCLSQAAVAMQASNEAFKEGKRLCWSKWGAWSDQLV